MLEQLHRTPEERRKTEIVLHLGVIAFALYNFAELAALLGPAPVLAGIATGLCGFLYSQWLRTRWNDQLRPLAVSAPGNRPRRLRAM